MPKFSNDATDQAIKKNVIIFTSFNLFSNVAKMAMERDM